MDEVCFFNKVIERIGLNLDEIWTKFVGTLTSLRIGEFMYIPALGFDIGFGYVKLAMYWLSKFLLR